MLFVKRDTKEKQRFEKKNDNQKFTIGIDVIT
jgi:hypothetical protein